MGRKTHESIGRLLPGRRTIIVSRNPAYRVEGATVADSVEHAIAAAAGESEVFVVGGGEIYALSLPLADRLLVTEVDLAPEGDAFFPAVDLSRWREVGREEKQTEEGIRYAFADYERVAPTQAEDRTP
jgi:dihydrofolate reductase